MVHWRLRKIKPEIIGITGSIGKTSTKDAIYAVLAPHLPTYCNQRSLNSDFGALLAILEQKSGYSSIFHWIKALWGGFWGTINLNRNEPPYEKLVLEMGADKPGDIAYLVRHIKPSIGVLCNVKGVHLAKGQFEDVEEVFKEKSKLIRSLPKNGWAILNSDDEYAKTLIGQVNARCVTFGTSTKADLRATKILSGPNGLRFTLRYENQSHDFHFPHILGKHHVYVLLPAIAIGFIMGIPIKPIKKALADFRLPPGRMNPIPGLHNSLIIDSSYNASPETMLAALTLLKSMPGRKIAVLGSMNELGEYSEREHRRIGEQIPHYADLLITVGKEAEYMAMEAQHVGFPHHKIHRFDSSLEAAQFLRDKIKKGDIILAKGSQNNVRLEHLVKELMRYPDHAEALLVRQDHYWKTH